MYVLSSRTTRYAEGSAFFLSTNYTNAHEFEHLRAAFVEICVIRGLTNTLPARATYAVELAFLSTNYTNTHKFSSVSLEA